MLCMLRETALFLQYINLIPHVLQLGKKQTPRQKVARNPIHVKHAIERAQNVQTALNVPMFGKF